MTKRLDVVWATASVLLAAWSLYEAWQEQHVTAGLYFALHLQAAVLFAIRHRSTARAAGATAYVVATLSVLSPYAYDVWAPTLIDGLDSALVAAGCVCAFTATWSLGRAYGVLPMHRGLRSHGAYAIVRHPVYASYIAMDVGIVVGAFSVRNILVFMAALGLVYRRALYEESLLRLHAGYSSYARNVPDRFLPLTLMARMATKIPFPIR